MGRVLSFDRDQRPGEGGDDGAPPGDEAARARIRTSLDESLLVEAAAGTGKTTVLVDRLVATIETGRARIERVVALTFTRKAAGELKLRLRQELDRARQRAAAPERAAGAELARIEDAIARLEEARVGTIHSFCAELLRERPVEAGIDPSFEEVAEGGAERLYRRVFDRFIAERLEDLPEGLRRALSRLAYEGARPSSSSALDRLRAAGWSLIEWRDFPASWRRDEFARQRSWAIDELVVRVRELAALVAHGRDRDELVRSLQPVVLLGQWVDRFEAVEKRDYDALEARLIELATVLQRSRYRQGRGVFADSVAREEVQAQRDQLIEIVANFARAANADLAALLQQELSELVVRYEQAKRQAGRLDFLDLLLRARDLVRDNREVRCHLQQRFSHVFVDEFQDTDPLQAEILLLLTADDEAEKQWTAVRPVAGKLFVVGDPKQSIYRFRRADVRLYQQVKQQLARAGVATLELRRSFRAVPDIQHLVNRAFGAAMAADSAGSPAYIPLEQARSGSRGQPAVVVLPPPYPLGDHGVTAGAIEKCLPRAAAAWVRWLLDSGHEVEDPEHRGRRVPVQARHVCLLFRRFMAWSPLGQQDVAALYTQELEAYGIPHLLLGARTFHQREEVESLRAALIAVEWPDDELAVFATLRGALFAFSDEDLLRYRHDVGRLHPFRSPPGARDQAPSELRPVAEALDKLAQLHRRRNARAVVRTVIDLLDYTRAHAGFAMRPAGQQALANVERVCDLARAYELGGGRSFRGFVDTLNEEASKPSSSDAPVVEEGADGVRLMTVHNAKGLEFPVVVLADITAPLSFAEPDRTVDAERGLCAQKLLGWKPIELLEQEEAERARDAAEGLRLAYVAATRARDLLVVPAPGCNSWDRGWIAPLYPALFPERDQWSAGTPAPGCPPFGRTTILESPQPSVKPGRYLLAADGVEGGGAYSVVFWDPAVLPPPSHTARGLRQDELLRAPTADAGADDGADYERWRSEHERALAAGREPSVLVVAVTELRDEEPPGASDLTVTALALERARDRPGGTRFGTLVHAALRDVDLRADRAAICALLRFHGRLLDADEAEIAAAEGVVATALGHPLLVRAAALPPAMCRREVPFALVLPPRRMVEGVIDLLVHDGDGWVVVDWKTDADLSLRREHYQRQVRWYLWAMQRLLEAPVRGLLLGL